MIKCKWSYLVFLIFIPVVYGCSSTQVSTLPTYSTRRSQPVVIVPYGVRKELNQFKIRPWKYIVIHYSASDSGDAASIGKYHRENRGWVNGLE